MRFVLLLSLAAASAGCNCVAILEGDLSVPPRPEQYDDLWVSVEVMRSSTPFEEEWAGTALEPMQLTNARQPYLFSVKTETPEGDLHVKVRFCRTRSCDFLDPDSASPADPQSEIWYFVEQPFYLNDGAGDSQTRWQQTIEDIPRCEPCNTGLCATGTCNSLTNLCETSPGTCVQNPVMSDCTDMSSRRPTWRCEVDKCSIEGCISGTPSDYCDTLPSGEEIHICET